jgi:hypothetical protein
MEPVVRSLKEMTGEFIIARIPALDKENMVVVRLHKLEKAGIWIESHPFNEAMLEKYCMPGSVTSLLLFIPFSGIDYIVSSIHAVVLSETAFGLHD